MGKVIYRTSKFRYTLDFFSIPVMSKSFFILHIFIAQVRSTTGGYIFSFFVHGRGAPVSDLGSLPSLWSHVFSGGYTLVLSLILSRFLWGGGYPKQDRGKPFPAGERVMLPQRGYASCGHTGEFSYSSIDLAKSLPENNFIISTQFIILERSIYLPLFCRSSASLQPSAKERSGGSRISQRRRRYPQRGEGRQPIIWLIFPENCMKMKKF